MYIKGKVIIAVRFYSACLIDTKLLSCPSFHCHWSTIEVVYYYNRTVIKEREFKSVYILLAYTQD